MNIAPFSTCNAVQKCVDATGKLTDLPKQYHIMPFYANFQCTEQNMHEKWMLASVQPTSQPSNNVLVNAPPPPVVEHASIKPPDIKKEMDASESGRTEPAAPIAAQAAAPAASNKAKPKRRHIKNFACDKCPKRFDSRSKLKDHQYVHTGEKPYQCQLCDSAFRNVNNLGRHSMVHFSEKNFKCNMCSSSFKCAAYLRKHMFTHTMTKKCVTCKLCSKQFTRPEFLRRHHRRVHSNVPKSEQFDCQACDKKFYDANALKEHQMTHGSVVYNGQPQQQSQPQTQSQQSQQNRSNDVNAAAFDKR